MSSSSQPNWKRSEVRFLEPKINIYYKWKIFKIITKALTSIGETNLVEQFVGGCFGRVSFWRGGNSASRALHVLMSYEVDSPNSDEIWFSIQNQSFRFTYRDYALVTGLRFGFSDFDPNQGSYDPSGVGVYIRIAGGSPIVLKELLCRFTGLSLHGDAEIPIDEVKRDYLKVANILALYFFFLGFAESRKVENWIWVLVDDLSAWNKFSWGAYTYGALMHYVGLIPTTRVDALPTYHLYGPMWALQVWAYETMPLLGDAAANIAELRGLPRVMKWKFGTPQEMDFKRIFGVEFFHQDLLPTNLELEQDYLRSTMCDAPFGVRFVRVDNLLHPRLMHEGRPVLFRVAKEIKKHTSKKRRKQPSSTNVKEHDTYIQPSQPERRRRDRAKGRAASSRRRDADEGIPPSNPNVGSDRQEIVRDIIREITTTVMSNLMKDIMSDLKSLMESFFGSKHFSKSMSRSPGEDEASSSASNLVSVHREPSRRAPDGEPSRHSYSARTQRIQSRSQTEPVYEPQPLKAHLQYKPEGHHQYEPESYSQCEGEPERQPQPHYEPQHQPQYSPELLSQYEQEVQGECCPTPMMQSEHQSYISAVALTVVEAQQHQSSSYPIEFFGGSEQFMRMYYVASSHLQPSLTPEADPQAIFVKHTRGSPASQNIQTNASPNIQSHELESEDDPESSYVRQDRTRSASQNIQSPNLPEVLCQEDHSRLSIITKTLNERYAAYREAGQNAPHVVSMESNFHYDPIFFQQIEDMDIDFDANVIDLYILVLRSRLVTDLGLQMHATTTAIIDSTFFFAMKHQWLTKVDQPHSDHHKGPLGMYDYWKPSEDLMMYIHGKTVATSRAWYDCSELIMPCLLFSHWVVVHVNLITWRARVYDTLYWNASEETIKQRQTALRPITNFLQRYLDYARYWIDNTVGARDPKWTLLPLEFAGPDDVFKQTDHHSCGPMACMMVDRLISGGPSIEWGNENVHKYRVLIATNLFGLCYTK